MNDFNINQRVVFNGLHGTVKECDSQNAIDLAQAQDKRAAEWVWVRWDNSNIPVGWAHVNNLVRE